MKSFHSCVIIAKWLDIKWLLVTGKMEKLPQHPKDPQAQQPQKPVKGNVKVFVPKKSEKQSNEVKIIENLETNNQEDPNEHIDIVPDRGDKEFEIPRDDFDDALDVDNVHVEHPEQPNDEDNDSMETVYDESQTNPHENSDYGDMPSLIDDSQYVIVLDPLDGNATPSVNKHDALQSLHPDSPHDSMPNLEDDSQISSRVPNSLNP